MKTVTLAIVGMHCTSCAMNIDMDLEDLSGVSKVSTSYPTGLSTVVFDENKISLPTIMETIQKTGYTPSIKEDL